jgi:hypothetical protein
MIKGLAKRIFLLSFLLGPLSCPKFDFYILDGTVTIYNYTRGTDTAKILHTIKEVSYIFDYTFPPELTIIFKPHELHCGEYTTALGCYWCGENYMEIYVPKHEEDCISNTSLVHELAHYYLDILTFDCDANHNITYIWKKVVPTMKFVLELDQCEVLYEPNFDSFLK